MLDRRVWRRVALLVGTLLAGAVPAGAGQVNVLDVQFGTASDPTSTSPSRQGTPNQDGFTLLTLGIGTGGGQQSTPYTASLTTNQGTSVGLTITNLPSTTTSTAFGAIGALDRGKGAPGSNTGSGATGTPNGNLLQGFFYNTNGTQGNTSGLSFALTGLVAAQTYAVDIFSYVRTIGAAGSPPGMSTWTVSGNPTTTSHTTSTDPYAADFILYGVADASGNLTFSGRSAGSPDGVIVNGFEIIATPEPGTLGMACCGIVGLGGFVTIRSRRRRNSAA